MIDGILFDLDGVLVDSRDVWFRLVNHAASAFGQPALTRADFARIWGQGVQADARMWGREVAEVEAFFDAHFMDHAGALRVDPAAAGLLERLRAAGVGTALVTNTPSALAREILARTGLALDAVVGGTDVPAAKPAPDMVRAACEALGVAPARALVVGDSAYDRDAAAAAGVYFVGLGIEGDESIERLAELPGRLAARGVAA